jgi:hypothetical protein
LSPCVCYQGPGILRRLCGRFSFRTEISQSSCANNKKWRHPANSRVLRLSRSSEVFSMSILLDRTERWGLLEQEPIAVASATPEDDRWVLVLTSSYRCLGYQHAGVWRDVAHGERIREPVLAWIPVDKPPSPSALDVNQTAPRPAPANSWSLLAARPWTQQNKW